MWRGLDHRVHPQGTARRDLLEVPSLLHRQAEARRHGRPYRPLPEEVREEIMASLWRGSARIIAGAFGAFTNGLTSAMPSGKPDKNVDMLIGGQAVIEGVMMRSLTGYSVAVRQPDGGVAIRKDKLVSITTKYPLLKTPVLRGSVVLIQSLILGIQSLNYSASVSSAGEDGEPDMSSWAIAGSMIMALLLGVGLFILAPLGLTNVIRHYLFPEMGNFAYNLI